MNDLPMLLAVARDTVARDQFDAELALQLLVRLQSSDLDIEAHNAVRQARLAAITALDVGSSRIAVARYALARVVALLEAMPPQKPSGPDRS